MKDFTDDVEEQESHVEWSMFALSRFYKKDEEP